MQKLLTRADFDDFVAACHAEDRHQHQESERFHVFNYEKLVQCEEINLNISWLQERRIIYTVPP
jgi:hypothetical protein